jgi:hypothetical protein
VQDPPVLEVGDCSFDDGAHTVDSRVAFLLPLQ